MIEFAVTIEGEDPNQGWWVLFVDPGNERLLIAKNDRILRWVNIADCRFFKAQTPDQPRTVIPVKTQSPLARPKVIANPDWGLPLPPPKGKRIL